MSLKPCQYAMAPALHGGHCSTRQVVWGFAMVQYRQLGIGDRICLDGNVQKSSYLVMDLSWFFHINSTDLIIMIYIYIYICVFFIFILSWFNYVFLLNGTFQQLRRPIFVHRGLTGLRVLWVWCPATISCRFTYQEMLELTGRNWKYLYLGDLAICWVTFGGSLHRIIRIQPAVSPLLWHGAAIKHGFPENPPNDFAAKPPLSSGSFQPRFGYRYLVSDIPSGKLT